MSLNDRETLDLDVLCNALVEGTISSSKRARLEHWLANSEEARQYYIKAMDLSASLNHFAGEMQQEPADRRVGFTRRVPSKLLLLAGLAACLTLAISLLMRPVQSNVAKSAAEPAEYVARITGTKGLVVEEGEPALKAGDFLRRGQRLKLAAGFAEVTFDSGAVVLLEAPAKFDVKSAWDSVLRLGALKAYVPTQALGFRVVNSAVEVVDLGTEFSMVADGHDAADVFVLQGEVEASPRGREDPETILMRANESRRFIRSSDGGSIDRGPMPATLQAPVTLDRAAGAVKQVQWAFDETEGKEFSANASGFEGSNFALNLLSRSPEVRRTAHANGFRNQGLKFDGNLIARADFPGFSGDFPRTISFWVKVPQNAALSGAYSMVAWRGDSPKLGERPVHIGWNRNPTEGPLGAIRTDFSGGHAMGITPIRDGKWHFVTVIFLVGDDLETAVQVKQYVDGRLESNRIVPGPPRSRAANVKTATKLAAKDRIWLGCRLGANQPKKERFIGEMDELSIFNRGLEPAEIVQLMDGLPVGTGSSQN